jgi:hypothetical protein
MMELSNSRQPSDEDFLKVRQRTTELVQRLREENAAHQSRYVPPVSEYEYWQLEVKIIQQAMRVAGVL